MEVTKATFARMAGISRQAVDSKIKHKTLILNSSGMIDTDNFVNREYLDKRKSKQQQNNPVPTSNFSGEMQQMPPPAIPRVQKEIPDAIAASAAGIPEYMLGLTIRELIAQYGSVVSIEKYVKILKDLSTADEKDQKLRERRNILIPKDFVTSHVFELLEQMLNKLLDMPERTVDNLIALAVTDAESSRQQIINTMRDNISVVITDTKDLVIRQLESLKGKYDDTTQETLQELKDQITELSENGG